VLEAGLIVIKRCKQKQRRCKRKNRRGQRSLAGGRAKDDQDGRNKGTKNREQDH
jgi:hypothetical protein